MSNMKISDYTQVIDLGGNEFLLISQDGVYKKVTLDQIRNLATDITNTELADLVGKVASATDVKNILATVNASLSDMKNDNAYALDTGTVNNIVIADIVPTAYKIGQRYRIKAKFANTGACSIKVGTLVITPIKKHVTLDLVTGDILLNQIITVIFDGTNFQIVPDFNTHKSEIFAKQLTITRDVSLAGIQTVSLPFLAKSIIIHGIIYTTKCMCFGQYAEASSQRSTLIDSSGNTNATPSAITFLPGGLQATGYIQNVTITGFDINWVKIGSPTGTATISILAQSHY